MQHLNIPKLFKIKLLYIFLSVIFFITEVLIALYVHDNFIRPFFGDFLVVILIYCFIRGIFSAPVLKTALSVLVFSYITEFLQYLHIVNILGLQNIKIARIIIGTSFSWNDIICYTLGILSVILMEWKVIFNRRT